MIKHFLAHLSNADGAIKVPVSGASIAHVLYSLQELWPGYEINYVTEAGEW